jgi:hypothetical protein
MKKIYNANYYNLSKILFDRVIENINNEAIELAFEQDLIEDYSDESLLIVENILKQFFTLKQYERPRP